MHASGAKRAVPVAYRSISVAWSGTDWGW